MENYKLKKYIKFFESIHRNGKKQLLNLVILKSKRKRFTNVKDLFQ